MKIYIASKTEHAPTWRRMRAMGAPIISSWIDEAGIGESGSMAELWVKIMAEVVSCDRLVFFANVDDAGWKGAFVEVGMALALGKKVIVCLPSVVMCERYRPIGSWVMHPEVERNDDIDDCLQMRVKSC